MSDFKSVASSPESHPEDTSISGLYTEMLSGSSAVADESAFFSRHWHWQCYGGRYAKAWLVGIFLVFCIVGIVVTTQVCQLYSSIWIELRAFITLFSICFHELLRNSFLVLFLHSAIYDRG